MYCFKSHSGGSILVICVGTVGFNIDHQSFECYEFVFVRLEIKLCTTTMAGTTLMMMTTWHGNTFCIISPIARFTGPTLGSSGPTGPRWAPCWPHGLCYLGFPLCVHRSSVDSPNKVQVMWSSDVLFVDNLKRLLNWESWRWWFDTSRRSCDITVIMSYYRTSWHRCNQNLTDIIPMIAVSVLQGFWQIYHIVLHLRGKFVCYELITWSD